MNDEALRLDLMRLAQQVPEMREHLQPLLQKAGATGFNRAKLNQAIDQVILGLNHAAAKDDPNQARLYLGDALVAMGKAVLIVGHRAIAEKLAVMGHDLVKD